MNWRLNLRALWLLGYALAFLGSWVVAPVYAATEYTVGPWKLVRSGVTQAPDYQTHAACDAALRAQPVAIGSTVTLRCQQTVVARGVRDPQVCPSQPAPLSQPGSCPAGTTGTWTQNAAFSSAPYPQCWTQGPWIPAEPPIGACVSPPPPPPPPTGDWIHCANQEEILCTDRGTVVAYTGTRVVRFGVDTRWIEREFPSGTRCNSTTFGRNPAQNVPKTCQVRGTVTPPPPDEPPPPATGTATLSWTPSSTMSDGTPATLAGYRIRYGRSPDTLTLQREVADAGSTSLSVDSLATGTWFFAVTAYDTQGRESLPSNVASKAVQ